MDPLVPGAGPEPVVPPADVIAPVDPAEVVAPTAEEQAAAADDKEWDDAADDLFPGLKKVKEEAETSTTTTTVAPETTTTTTTVDPAETPEQKTEREKKEAEAAKDPADVEAEAEAAQAARDARLSTREAAKAVEAVAVDVREKMFADAPKELVDGDGDPIKSIEDVMKLENPRTGQAFTEEEAGMWLLSAQQAFNKNVADMDKQIEQIAEVNVDLKDQADAITFRYGELLKADVKLRERIWTEFEKTLVKDPKSGIVTKMPVSLENFYEIALEPYAQLAKSLEDQETAKAKETEDAAKAEEDRKKKAREDRSDIFGRGKDPDEDPEDKEWGDAAIAVFGPRKAK